ncbi:response regulator [Pseudoalteromonas tunicata]|uniref:Response regulator receiver domain protein (CheY-like) n=1 Tax=Pseudoalteromonas tunicata D2 TaxID=87626 RepID=A4C4T0_9GAMM|nr:response regulator [Pseudoalteromonas tunicata]ATC96959.1 hypothetical protein PTUN_b0600 [Pseudoalteromonas tunicata]AXT33084.1 DNA-binding response regulator [Pseudoalteromonas tunicata]EAR30562.1 response regulator receiver domain protein (CheY-like) [Pseudoalteromonas tunicata D2]
MQKILIVEDDLSIAQGIELFFRANQFDTLHIDDGDLVVNAVKHYQPDLILLDLMLPNKDGMACCQAIRLFSDVPIVMLTAIVEQQKKLQGLQLGIDDYICKPFDAMEVVLRAKAILKRSIGQVQYNTLALNADALEIKTPLGVVSLSHSEFSLFELLFINHERIFSRDKIIELAYPELHDINDRTIDSHIKNIRKKFKVTLNAVAPIESVYGAGYRINIALFGSIPN